jgi:proton-dependent oligopeptide transporter, POT family
MRESEPDAPWPLRGHSRGLMIAALTGMWEVFAIFGMRTVLVFYLIKDLAFAPTAAVEVYSFSTAAAFATPLLGALAADRVIGIQRAVLVGAITMAVGHALLLVPSLLYPALAIITLGNGLFKPSIISQVGLLYSPDDPRRDRAFVIFKASCNAGAIFSPLVCGAIGQVFGWPAALAVCSASMAVSALIYAAGKHYLGSHLPHQQRSTTKSTAPLSGLAALSLVLLSAAIFWTAHGQQAGTIALWAEKSVDRSLTFWGHVFSVPATWFQSINPIIIVLSTPLIAWLWSKPSAVERGRGEMRKMIAGTMLLAASFGVAALAAATSSAGSVAVAWLLVSLLLLTLGEMYFDPIAQAFVLRLASTRTMSTFVSFLLLTQAIGFAGAGWVATLWGRIETAHYFLVIAAIAGASACVLLAARAYLPIANGRGV